MLRCFTFTHTEGGAVRETCPFLNTNQNYVFAFLGATKDKGHLQQRERVWGLDWFELVVVGAFASDPLRD